LLSRRTIGELRSGFVRVRTDCFKSGACRWHILIVFAFAQILALASAKL
jgi:hypothetical protein